MKEAKTYWFPLTPDSRTDYVLHVVRTSIQLFDKQMTVAGAGLEDLVGFYAQREAGRVIPYLNDWQTAITIEMSMNRHDYFRKVYNILDFISDVGGLYGAVSPICIIFLIIFNFWSS